LALPDGSRNTDTVPVRASQRWMRFDGMSLKSRQSWSPNHTGPSVQRYPVAICSTAALSCRYRSKRGSRARSAGSG
jgi:hypothetical protein